MLCAVELPHISKLIIKFKSPTSLQCESTLLLLSMQKTFENIKTFQVESPDTTMWIYSTDFIHTEEFREYLRPLRVAVSHNSAVIRRRISVVGSSPTPLSVTMTVDSRHLLFGLNCTSWVASFWVVSPPSILKTYLVSRLELLYFAMVMMIILIVNVNSGLTKYI